MNFAEELLLLFCSFLDNLCLWFFFVLFFFILPTSMALIFHKLLLLLLINVVNFVSFTVFLCSAKEEQPSINFTCYSSWLHADVGVVRYVFLSEHILSNFIESLSRNEWKQLILILFFFSLSLSTGVKFTPGQKSFNLFLLEINTYSCVVMCTIAKK